MRGDDRIKHLRDGPLLGLGQRFDELKLLRDFGLRPTLACCALGWRCANKLFDGLKCWQVRKPAVGRPPRIQALSSVAQGPDERWVTDLCRIWAAGMAG